MTTLRWPDGRGKFVDDDTDRTPDGERLEIFPGTEIEVEDSDAKEHYLDRGFVVVEPDGGDGGDADAGSEGSADAEAESGSDDGDGSEDGFDAEAFADRTPVSDVVDDIEDGKVDDHLDAIADADDRVTVEAAIEDRQEAIGSD